MYKIIGADQREYGPCTADEIRRWIAEGRANGRTLAKPEGSNEWKPLSSFPDFAGLEAPPPATYAPDLAGSVLAVHPQLSIIDCLNRGWHLLMSNFLLLFPATVLICLIRFVLAFVPAVNVLAMLFTGVFYGGLYSVFLKRIRVQPASIGDAFSGFGNNFTQLLLVGIISLILTMIGWLLCLLPGLFLFVAWIFAIPLVADKHLSFWDAMELSRKVVMPRWFQIAALLLLCYLPVILFAIYVNYLSSSYIASLVHSGQLDFSLALNNPHVFMAQITNASRSLIEKFLYLGLFQQLLLLLVQPFAKAALMHAYEVLFNPRPAPPA